MTGFVFVAVAVVVVSSVNKVKGRGGAIFTTLLSAAVDLCLEQGWEHFLLYSPYGQEFGARIRFISVISGRHSSSSI